VSDRASVFFFYGIYVFAQCASIIGMDQKPMCSVQFKFHLIFLDIPDGHILKQS